MTLFARINPDTTRPEVRDFAAAPSASKGWVPLIIDAQPTPTSLQAITDEGVVVGITEAHQTWGLRDKTAAELERDNLQAEKAQIDGYITDLNAQLGISNADRALLTNVQRINELEKDTRTLMKAAKYLLREAKRAF